MIFLERGLVCCVCVRACWCTGVGVLCTYSRRREEKRIIQFDKLPGLQQDLTTSVDEIDSTYTVFRKNTKTKYFGPQRRDRPEITGPIPRDVSAT